jgi:hypothetical protein
VKKVPLFYCCLLAVKGDLQCVTGDHLSKCEYPAYRYTDRTHLKMGDICVLGGEDVVKVKELREKCLKILQVDVGIEL